MFYVYWEEIESDATFFPVHFQIKNILQLPQGLHQTDS